MESGARTREWRIRCNQVTIHGTSVDDKEDKMQIFCFERKRFYFLTKNWVMWERRIYNQEWSRYVVTRPFQSFCQQPKVARIPTVHALPLYMYSHTESTSEIASVTFAQSFSTFSPLHLQLSLQGRFSSNEYYGQKAKWCVIHCHTFHISTRPMLPTYWWVKSKV